MNFAHYCWQGFNVFERETDRALNLLFHHQVRQFNVSIQEQLYLDQGGLLLIALPNGLPMLPQ
jgi:hypothetical protein